jgi:diguanylate cyclase (GGDEF)-like protein
VTRTTTTNSAPNLPLLAKYGFDAQRREQYLLHIGLQATDVPLVKILHDQIIIPAASRIIAEFYDYLLKLPSMRQYLPKNLIPRLKRTQEEYLLSFGVEFATPYYFEYRLRIGIAHERVGLTLDLYQAAYRQLTARIIAAIPESLRNQTEQYQVLIDLILKIAALDSSLAMETYIAARVATMSESIADLQEQQQELTIEIQRDALTGAHSRRYVLEHLDHMLHSKQRQSDIKFCIAMLDLDHFKKVNDNYGHLVGDRLLRYVAVAMQQSIRSIDLLGRYGGEEFLIIFPDTDIKTACLIAERVRNNIAAKPFVVDNHRLSITTSIGVSEYHHPEKSENILQRADMALYAAKHSGRNCLKCQN